MTVYTAANKRVQSSDFHSIGIDKVSFLVPLEEPLNIPKRKVYSPWEAHLGSVGGVARVEYNPARITSDASIPCPFESFEETARLVWDRVVAPLRPAVSLGEARVTRLDLVRDFEGVDHVAAVIDGLKGIPRPRRLRANAYNNGHVIWRPSGLEIGTRDKVLLYDRHALHQDIPEGVVRFEVRALRGWLPKAQIARVSDINREKGLAFLYDRWCWGRLGERVVHADAFTEAVYRAPWSEREKAMFHWSESKRQVGLPVDCSRPTAARHKQFRAEIGMPVPMLDAMTVQLDFMKGTEIVRW